MHLDPRIIRGIAIGLAILLLYGSRLTKGSVSQTTEGLAFRIKPLFAWSRAIALPAYILFFAYITLSQKQPVPGGWRCSSSQRSLSESCRCLAPSR